MAALTVRLIPTETLYGFTCALVSCGEYALHVFTFVENADDLHDRFLEAKKED